MLNKKKTHELCRKAIGERLKENWDIEGEYAERLTNILMLRAVRFYLEDELDSAVIAEEMYEEDGEYPNLDYGERTEPEMLMEA